MDLKKETIELAKLYGIKPTKNRGQSFLINEEIYQAIISAAKIKKTETVLEVGPGLGFLTLGLARVAKEVVAVELDKKLASALQNKLDLENITNVKIFNEDIMNFTGEWAKTLKKISSDNLIVVANLPYTITSIFLRYFIGGNLANIMPQRLVLMLQKEVGERLVAQAGAMNVLALSVQLYAQPKIITTVSKNNFWPVPKVDSVVVEFKRDNNYLQILQEQKLSDKDLLRLIKIGFSAKRKMLKANLANGYKKPLDKILEHFCALNIRPGVRAQELSLEQWLKLLLFFS